MGPAASMLTAVIAGPHDVNCVKFAIFVDGVMLCEVRCRELRTGNAYFLYWHTQTSERDIQLSSKNLGPCCNSLVWFFIECRLMK